MIRILLVVFMLTGLSVFAEQTKLLGPTEALREQNDSLNRIFTVTERIRENFKSNAIVHQFMYQNLYQHQVMRIQEKDAVFPRTNNITKGYNEEYWTLTTKYLLAMDEDYLKRTRNFLNNYCKYNSYRMKDPQACAPERIEPLFKKE